MLKCILRLKSESEILYETVSKKRNSLVVEKSTLNAFCFTMHCGELNPRATLGFNIVESKGKPRVLANTLGFR
jgi:hypothetical protein